MGGGGILRGILHISKKQVDLKMYSIVAQCSEILLFSVLFL